MTIEIAETKPDEKFPGAARLEGFTERFAPFLVGLLLVYTFIRASVAAMAKVFWYDELLTRLVVTQQNWKEMMAAVRAPVDSQPPMYYLLEHWTWRLFGQQDVALRLPSIFGFAATIVCVFVFVRRWGNKSAAALASAFLLTTVLFGYYAQEARPYSLVVACLAFALVCYQRAESWRWVVLLALSLTVAEALHYLAVLTIIPFGLAELARIYLTKKVRWRVWLALMFGAAPLIPYWGILKLNRDYYGPHHNFLDFRFTDIPQMYGNYFALESRVGMAIAVTAAAGVVVSALWRRPATSRPESRDLQISNYSEAVLILALIGLPFVAYGFGVLTNSGINSRYALATVVGISLGLGFLLSRAGWPAVVLFSAFVTSMITVSELHFWRSVGIERRETANTAVTARNLIASAGRDGLPVVVPNGDILVLQYYLGSSHSPRMVFLTKDPDMPHDTLDKGLMLASRYAPIEVDKFVEFTRENRQFLVYMTAPEASQRWITMRLRQEGWSVAQLKYDGFRELDLVEKIP